LLHFGHLTDFPAGTRFGDFMVTPQSGFGHVYETAINNSAIRPQANEMKEQKYRTPMLPWPPDVEFHSLLCFLCFFVTRELAAKKHKRHKNNESREWNSADCHSNRYSDQPYFLSSFSKTYCLGFQVISR
jgi:hypothetical protein